METDKLKRNTKNKQLPKHVRKTKAKKRTIAKITKETKQNRTCSIERKRLTTRETRPNDSHKQPDKQQTKKNQKKKQTEREREREIQRETPKT